MARGFIHIRNALEQQLYRHTDGVVKVHFENIGGTRTELKPFRNEALLRVVFAPTASDAGSMGHGGFNRHTGVFLVDCIVGEGTGPGHADELSDFIMNEVFPRGTRLNIAHEGEHVITGVPERGPGQQDGPNYFAPVAIPWTAYLITASPPQASNM